MASESKISPIASYFPTLFSKPSNINSLEGDASIITSISICPFSHHGGLTH